MDYNCEKNVVSNLWKGWGMAGAEVLQRTNVWELQEKGWDKNTFFIQMVSPILYQKTDLVQIQVFLTITRGAERLQLLDKPCCSFHCPARLGRSG